MLSGRRIRRACSSGLVVALEAELRASKPLVDLVTIISLIGDTTTAEGLRVRSEVDPGLYPKRVVMSESMAHLSQADCTRIATKLTVAPANAWPTAPPRNAMSPDRYGCTTNLISSFHKCRQSASC